MVFRWILLILFLLKPANITFKIIFGGINPDVDNNDDNIQDDKIKDENRNNEGVSIKNAGAFIGNFERTLYAICLAFGQYTVMGLIITCKGFARHSSIQKKPAFAEYFLIGTFYSMLYTFLSYLISFYLI